LVKNVSKDSEKDCEIISFVHFYSIDCNSTFCIMDQQVGISIEFKLWFSKRRYK